MFATALSVCALTRGALAQSVETQQKPPSLLFENAAGTVVTSVPVDKKYRLPVVKMEVSSPSHTAYVLNAASKSSERSVTAVDLATQKIRQVINIGEGKQADLLMSEDGRRLFAYTISAATTPKGSGPALATVFEAAHLQKPSGSDIITVIETNSNRIIGKLDLMQASGLNLPHARFIETSLYPTHNGRALLVRIAGFNKYIDRPIWVRLAFFRIPVSGPPIVIDPGKPVVWSAFSENESFLFVAAEDKAGKSQLVRVVNLENGKTIDRTVDDPTPSLAHHRTLSPFLGGASPSWAEAKQGAWMRTGVGLRFISEDGEMGTEISVPDLNKAAILLSLDRSRLFVALPDEKHHSGTFYVVDFKKGTGSSCPLAYAPTKLIRLGPGRELWMVSREEIRPVSETGNVGERAILFKKLPNVEAENPSAADDLFLNGEPGEIVSLGEGRAAILITGRTGSSVHRVALLNLTQLRVDAIVTTMSAGEKAKTRGGRLLKMMGEDALAGGLNGLVAAGYGTPAFGAPAAPQPFGAPSTMWWALGNEALAAAPDGRNLYVLNTDTHKVSVIDVTRAAIVRHIEVDKSVNQIQLSADGTHLICIGPGLLREVDLGRTTVS